MTVMAKARTRVRGESASAGFTLIELLVVMALGAIIGTMVTSAIVHGLRDTTEVNAHQTSLEQTRTAMQRVTREIRDVETSGVLVAKDNEMLIAQVTDTGFRTMDFTIATTAGVAGLVLDESDYTGSGCALQSQSACTKTNRTRAIVLPSLANAASTPLFTYTPLVGFSPASSTVSATTCAVSGSSPTTYAPDCPGKVTIHLLQLIYDAPTNRPTDLSDTVELRNQTS